MHGTVKWFSNIKGFGFIENDEGEEFFVHYSQILKNGYKSLKKGQQVIFEISASEKGPVASNVEVLGR